MENSRVSYKTLFGTKLWFGQKSIGVNVDKSQKLFKIGHLKLQWADCKICIPHQCFERNRVLGLRWNNPKYDPFLLKQTYF